MLVSIIVPVYNVERYLSECIESILRQSWTNFELLLINDGSYDNSPLICEEYSRIDARICYVCQKTNQGQSVARNIGLDMAKGEIIAFVDSDDCVHPDYISTLVKPLLQWNLDIVCCNYRIFNESSLPVYSHSNTVYELKIRCGRDETLRFLRFEGVDIVPVCKAYRKILWENLRFPVGRIHEDNATLPIIYHKAQYVGAVEQVLYGYRMNPSSTTGGKFKKRNFMDIFYAIEIYRKYFEKQKDKEILEAIPRHYKVIHSSLILAAIHHNALAEIPAEYVMSKRKALSVLKTNLPPRVYIMWISRTCPGRARIERIRYMFNRAFSFLCVRG